VSVFVLAVPVFAADRGWQHSRTSAKAGAVDEEKKGHGGRKKKKRFAKTLFFSFFFSPLGNHQQPTKNWRGRGESDCLIKTKHCDGRQAVLTQCDFCPVL